MPPNGYYLPVKTPTGMDAATGDIIQTPEKLKALDGRSGALCIFAKLSVRMPGVFRLKFTLYETSTWVPPEIRRYDRADRLADWGL